MYDGQLTVEKAAGTSRSPGTRMVLVEGGAVGVLSVLSVYVQHSAVGSMYTVGRLHT